MKNRTHDKLPETGGALARADESVAVDELLALYVAGGLPRPLEAMIGAHLELREESRCFVDDLEALAGAALSQIVPQPLRNRDASLAAIMDSEAPKEEAAKEEQRPPCAIVPKSLADFTGHTADTIAWRSKLPGFKECKLPASDGCEASFFWIRPGRAVPQHRHEGVELTLVLQGSFCDERGCYERGDIAIADETVDHRPVAGKEGPCLCFAVTTGPTKLTGSLRQLFSDAIGR